MILSCHNFRTICCLYSLVCYLFTVLFALELKNLKAKKQLGLNSISMMPKEMSDGPLISEAYALVDSLHSWRINSILDFNMKNRTLGSFKVLTKGVGEELDLQIQKEIAKASDPITAIFINWPRLTTAQLGNLIRRWRLPVYDRLTLVTTLFRLNCTSPESRLQAKIAELSVLKTRIPAILFQNTSFTGQLNKVYEAIDNEETRMRKQLRELELAQSKNKINLRRRSMEQSPTISVLGYTNAGKTSLIKHFSRKPSLVPEDKVFATLNISTHQAFINCSHEENFVPGPGLRSRFIDTIGFMSDLPVEFLAAFRATLRECFFSDLILNVVDVSETDWRLKANFVHSMIRNTFCETKHQYNPDDQLPQVVTVGTKIDLIPDQRFVPEPDAEELVRISLETGEGLENLHDVILSLVAKRKNWSKVDTIFDQSENEKLKWLYKNASITKMKGLAATNQLLVEVYISNGNKKKFERIFQQ